MKELNLKDEKKMLIFDIKDNLCPYCSYPLSEDENPYFRNQCYSCNSIAKAIRDAPQNSFIKKMPTRPYYFDKIVCLGEYYKLKESLKESKDPAHLLSLCIIHYKDHTDNVEFFSSLLKQKIENFMEKNLLRKKDIILCGIPDLISKEHQKTDLLCKKISQKTGIVYIPFVKKVKEIPKQHKKEKIIERYENVQGAYVIDEKRKFDIDKKIIFLIDDIISTMASVSECSKKLKGSGAKKVYVFALGRNIFRPKQGGEKNEHI